MSLRRIASLSLLACGSATIILACGSRTGLLAPEEVTADATPDRRDGGRDADADADAIVREEDALPGLDVQKDVPKPPPLGCTDAGRSTCRRTYRSSSRRRRRWVHRRPPTLNALAFYRRRSASTIRADQLPRDERNAFLDGRRTLGHRLFGVQRQQALSGEHRDRVVPIDAIALISSGTARSAWAAPATSSASSSTCPTTPAERASPRSTGFALLVGPFVPSLPLRCEMTGTSNDGALCILHQNHRRRSRLPDQPEDGASGGVEPGQRRHERRRVRVRLLGR